MFVINFLKNWNTLKMYYNPTTHYTILNTLSNFLPIFLTYV